MGRNLFAPQGEQQQPRKGRNLFAQPSPEDFSQRTAGMTREQILEEYRNAEINSPYYNHLVNLIEQPQAGETPEQAAVRAGGVKPRGAPSQVLSGFGGAADTLSFGFADEIGAGVAAMGGDDYDQALEEQRRFRQDLEEENPGSYLTGQIAGIVPQVAATLGASAPLTAGGRLLTNTGYGALQSGLYGVGSGEGVEGSISEGLEGAAWGAGLGLLPSAAEGIYKGGKYLINKGVKNVQKVTNPRAAAEKTLIEDITGDWSTQRKLDARAARKGVQPQPRRFLTADEVDEARAAGQTPMLSDIGGDATRRRLKAVDNISTDGSALLRGAAAQRHVDQGQRVSNVVADSFGDINPKSVRDELGELANEQTNAAYKLAEQNPNAAHLWNPRLQRMLSTPEGKRAIKKAIENSRRQALENGEEIIEPVFEEGADGLLLWTGKFRRPTGEIAEGINGLGVGLRFWDSIKKSMDDEINSLMKGGYNEEAKAIRGVKNNLVRAVDDLVPEYKTARGTAKEFFDAEDAHEAGAKYFSNMNAYDTAEARAAIKSMKPAERELFARGYAAELVNRISRMGEAENVNKLFKSKEARMKMRDALGDQVADQLEAYTHREMVQGLLGQHLGANSTTWQQALAAEGLKATATGGGAGAVTGLYTGDPMAALYATLGGAALRGGYRATQRMVIDKYSRAMAELATSEDPEVISRILSKVSKDSGYMAFSRAAANGMGGAASGAGRAAAPPEINIPGGGLSTGESRIEPRLPFAGGGLVKEAVEALIGAGAEVAPKAARRTSGRSTVANPVRKAFPGVYKEPRELLADVQIEPESPALRQLFGVTRDDLFEISKRKGNVDDILGIEGKTARPSEAVENIQTPRNARRLISALEAAQENEGLWKGMHGWYVMDPAYQYLVREYGPEEAERMFRRFNTLTGMSSPGSEVVTELQRGTAANMMDNLGRFDEFLRMGGIGKGNRGKDFPQELQAVDGHPYHSTSQAPAMDNYLRTGRVEMGSAKVPTYIGASTPPELGNFTDLPVADAHFTRAVGLPDTRTAEKVFDHSMTMGEYKSAGPWFRDEVANPADLESVPAQAILWGLYGPQTGVTTAVGAPKLELLARGIMETARRLGISPEKARDLVLTGRAHAYEQGGLVSALGAAA